jgi:PDZ domain
MKSAGVLTSRAREHHALGASLAAMLSVVLASVLAAAQSDTAASATWKTAAASAAAPAAAATAAPSVPGAPIAEAAVPVLPRIAVAPSVASANASGPANLVPTPLDNIQATQPGTTEIPGVNSAEGSPAAASTAPDSQASADLQSSVDGSEIARYQEEQSGMPPEQLRALQEFDSEGELQTPFGMQLREAKRTLNSGEDADGLLIIAVAKGSPAAAAGLHPYSHTVHDAIAAAAMVGAVFCGGLSVIVIPAIDYMQVGESYDLIIGVDGSRVTNFLDFQDRMRDLQPGELVYLSVVRDGKRLQVTMPVTTDVLQAATN